MYAIDWEGMRCLVVTPVEIIDRSGERGGERDLYLSCSKFLSVMFYLPLPYSAIGRVLLRNPSCSCY